MKPAETWVDFNDSARLRSEMTAGEDYGTLVTKHL
jgi:hypothetical protein